jgi:hypothetical protein
MGRVFLAVSVLALIVLGSAGGATGGELSTGVTAIRAPLPRNAGSHYDLVLADIACVSPVNCVATGNLYERSGHFHGVFLVEKAGKWKVSEASVPRTIARRGRRFVSLGAVACPAAGHCVAVGTAHVGLLQMPTPLIFVQRRKGWRVTVPSTPLGVKGAGLSLVSCPSRGNCTAAGSFTNKAGTGEGLLMSERAGRWGRPVAAALPVNAAEHPEKKFGEEAAEIDSLSCPSASACAAVGLYTETHGSPEGLLLTKSRGRWARGLEAQLPANAVQPDGSYEYPVIGLGSVSCSSANDCAAVGGYGDAQSNQFGMSISEHAGSWAPAQETPLPTNGGPNPQQGNNASSPLGTIACPSTGACSAVGYFLEKNGDNGVLLLNEQAGSWTASGLVFPAGVDERQGGLLDSLACPSAGNCVAAGSYTTGINQYQPMLATEQNGRWMQGTAVPLPPGVTKRDSGDLNSISCPSANDCVAVGGYVRSGGYPTQDGLIVTIHRG